MSIKSLSQNPIKQSKAIGVGYRKNERNLVKMEL
jgi:hypothetical protein